MPSCLACSCSCSPSSSIQSERRNCGEHRPPPRKPKVSSLRLLLALSGHGNHVGERLLSAHSRLCWCKLQCLEMTPSRTLLRCLLTGHKKMCLSRNQGRRVANPHKIRIAVRRYQAGGKQAWSQSALSGSWHLLGVLELRNSFQRLLGSAWQNQLFID